MPTAHVPRPQWTPSQREIDDLDLLLSGALQPPLDGFVDPSTAGPASPITLSVSRDAAEVAAGVGELDLIDPEGAPLARMTVTSTYAVEPAANDRRGVVGPVERLAHNEFGPFRRLHRSPERLHADVPRARVLSVLVHRPLTEADIVQIRDTASAHGLIPVLLPATGQDMSRGLSAPALVRASLVAAELIGGHTCVVAVSVADHGWQPTETHPTSPNQWLCGSVMQAYGDTTLELAETAAGDPPPDVAAIIERDRPRRDSQGVVFFFTGLSGSGKSTLARALVDHILERGERTVTSLDGDVVRHHLSEGLGFSRKDRETNILRIGYVAAEVSRHGGVAVCSPIAPFESTRAQVRQMVERAGGGFVLIHVTTPLEECERRDRKGLYAKARAGQIPDFTGISSPYEEPADAVRIDTTHRVVAQCVDEIMDTLITEGWLHP